MGEKRTPSVSFSLAESPRVGLRPSWLSLYVQRNGRGSPCQKHSRLGGDAMAPARDSLFFFLAHSLPLPPSPEPPKLSSSFRGTPRQRSCAKPAPRGAIVPIFGYHHKTKTPPGWVVFCLAEKERFELSRRVLWQPTPLAGAPLRPLEYFSIHRRVGLLV